MPILLFFSSFHHHCIHTMFSARTTLRADGDPLPLPLWYITIGTMRVYRIRCRRASPDWSNGNGPDEKATKYRLTIKDIQPQESGTYTCTSPRGLTNNIVIIVTSNLFSFYRMPTVLRLSGALITLKSLHIF